MHKQTNRDVDRMFVFHVTVLGSNQTLIFAIVLSDIHRDSDTEGRQRKTMSLSSLLLLLSIKPELESGVCICSLYINFAFI